MPGEGVEPVYPGEERPAGHRQPNEQDEERVEDPGPAQPHHTPLSGLASGAPKAAARIAPSVMAAPRSSAAIRPPRITSTRCASPRTSSASEEMSSTPRPSAASEGSSS